MIGAAPVAVPPLRDDLGLFPGPEAGDGSPTWTIHDPARNRYFRIGLGAFELLSRWHLGSPDTVASAAQVESGLEVDAEDVLWLSRFLDGNHLLRRDSAQGVERLLGARQAARKSWYSWLLHNYLFFRIPLVRPDRLLAATLPLVRPLFTSGFAVVVALAALIGMFLVVRQWDVFFATLPHFFSWQGALWLGGAMAVSKMVHEMGHAYTARRYGCRVPTMGLAFLVLWPVLYTDTSDTWRLVSRRSRMAVAGAGIAAELTLAVFAMLAWSFLPDGPVRSAAFAITTVATVTTLAINASPFMRFDGYYLLADALGIENMQDRSFALARWRLREWLFALDEPVPEDFPPRTRALLLAYAFGTWAYRLVLFVGIAVLVYHMFFKVLGLMLFAVEMGWFVLRPFKVELGEWWSRRDAMARDRLAWAGLGTGLVLLALVVPWQSSIHLPAVARASAYSTIYPPLAARVERLEAQPGMRVQAGEVVAELASPELDAQIARLENRLDALGVLIRREAADPKARAAIHVLRRQSMSAERELAGLRETRARLIVRAPVDGEVVAIPRHIRPGLWVSQAVALAQVADRAHPEVTAFLAEEDLNRLAVGAAARFIPDDPTQASHRLVVRSIAEVNAGILDLPYLESTHGGPIAVRPDKDKRPVPTKGIYRVELAFTESLPPLDKAARGHVVADGESRSLLSRGFDTVVAVLVRESGF